MGLFGAVEKNLHDYTFDDVYGHAYAGESDHSNDTVRGNGQLCQLQK